MKSRRVVEDHAERVQIDVLRGTCAFETRLESDTTLERRSVTENHGDACEEAIEDSELTGARDRNTGRRCRFESVLQRSLESCGRFVLLAHAGERVRRLVQRSNVTLETLPAGASSNSCLSLPMVRVALQQGVGADHRRGKTRIHALGRRLDRSNAARLQPGVLLTNEFADVLDAANPFPRVSSKNAPTQAELNGTSRHRIAVWIMIRVPL